MVAISSIFSKLFCYSPSLYDKCKTGVRLLKQTAPTQQYIKKKNLFFIVCSFTTKKQKHPDKLMSKTKKNLQDEQEQKCSPSA